MNNDIQVVNRVLRFKLGDQMDIDFVSRFSVKIGDLTFEVADSFTLLCIATNKGQFDVSQALIVAGANVNKCSERLFYSPLTLAADIGNISILSALIQAKANLEHKSKFGDNSLIIASKNGCFEAVDALLKAGASPNSRDVHQNKSALIICAEKGQLRTAKIIIEARADIEAKSENGDNALTLASRKGHTTLVQLLVDSGANIHESVKGSTAVELADNKAIVDILVRAGAPEPQIRAQRPPTEPATAQVSIPPTVSSGNLYSSYNATPLSNNGSSQPPSLGTVPGARMVPLVRQPINAATAGPDDDVGVGLGFVVADGAHIVSALAPNGSAEQSGQVHIGDTILSVDGIPTAGDVDTLVGLIKGRRGTTVRLVILPGGAGGGGPGNAAAQYRDLGRQTGPQQRLGAAPGGAPSVIIQKAAPTTVAHQTAAPSRGQQNAQPGASKFTTAQERALVTEAVNMVETVVTAVIQPQPAYSPPPPPPPSWVQPQAAYSGFGDGGGGYGF